MTKPKPSGVLIQIARDCGHPYVRRTKPRSVCACCSTRRMIESALQHCASCGSDLPPGRRGGLLYCSNLCRSRAAAVTVRAKERAMAREAQRRADTELKRTLGKDCAECGTHFVEPVVTRRLYCSAKCSRKAFETRVVATCSQQNCSNKVRAKGLCSGHYKSILHPDRPWAEDPEKRRRSWRRRNHERRAIIYATDAEVIDLHVIAERDGWRCGLCRRKVNDSLAWPHAQSKSLDHIVPLSLGGEHVATNVQLAHLICNTRKQARVTDVQPLLVG